MTGECRHRLLEPGGIESISPASAPGLLFDLGDYPGMILSREARVSGELIEFDDLNRILDSLDEEEGPEYRRELISVTLPAGRQQIAWSYVLVRAPFSAKVIASGDWRIRTVNERPSANPEAL